MAENIAQEQGLQRADAEPKEYCEGRAKATETVVDRDRDTARSEAIRLARKSAREICEAKRQCGDGPCKLQDIDTEVDVRPTQEIDEPRTYTAVATVSGRCGC